MTVNAEHRQVELAAKAEAATRSLAHSTRDVPNPTDSYRLLGELSSTVDHLEQTSRQLAAWHRRVVDGQHYRGEDENGDGVTGTLEAAEQLGVAAAALEHASAALHAAHAANSVVRWLGE